MPEDKLQITFRSRSVVVRRQYLYLFGYKLDLWDTLETIREVRDGSIQVIGELAEILIRANILESAGSRRNMMSATEGVRFDEFLKALEEREEKICAEE